ncbi:MAG: type II secretion system protein [Candidatus Doudnabacteria bacterium]
MKKNQSGFTILELLIVVAIIAILATIISYSVIKARAQSRDSKRIVDIAQLKTALRQYYDQNGYFPISNAGSGCGATVPNSAWCNSVQSYSSGHWIRHYGTSGVLSPFLAAEPVDPKQGSTAKYLPSSGGTYFYLSTYPGNWYMIIYGLESYPNNEIEQSDGVTNCTPTYYHYGNNSNGIITTGQSCIQ